MADVAQDRGDGGGARVDIGVDVERRHQGRQRRVVDQRDGHLATRLLGADRGEDVGLVVVGDGQNGIGAVDVGLDQQFHVHAVAVQHDGAFQHVGGAFGLGAVAFDHLRAHPACARLKRAGHGKADVAAADDDDPFLFLRRLAEDLQRAAHVLGMGEDIDLVAREKLVARFGREQPALAADADDDGPQR